jgi:hypothetical protein
MTWADIAFAHWRVSPEILRPLIPPELELDTHDDAAWIGLIPFEMRDCDFRGVPTLPGLGTFLECNVRTYVRHRGVPGVWFFSLDAESRLAVHRSPGRRPAPSSTSWWSDIICIRCVAGG